MNKKVHFKVDSSLDMVCIYWTKKHVWATKVTILFGWWKLIVTYKLFVHFFRFSHFWFFVLMPLCTHKTRLFKSTENILMPSAFAWVLTQIFLLKAIKSYFTQNMTKEVKIIHLFLFLKTLNTQYPCTRPLRNWNWHQFNWRRVFPYLWQMLETHRRPVAIVH